MFRPINPEGSGVGLDRIPWASIPILYHRGWLHIYLHEWVIFLWAKYVGKYATVPWMVFGIVFIYFVLFRYGEIVRFCEFEHHFRPLIHQRQRHLCQIFGLEDLFLWIYANLAATLCDRHFLWEHIHFWLMKAHHDLHHPVMLNIPRFDCLVITTTLSVAGCSGKSSWTHERFWTSHVFLTLLASLLLLKATCSSALRQQNPARPSPKGKARIWSNETKIEL